MKKSEIITERLLLRRHRLDDADDVAALWADPEVVRHIGHPSTGQESWSRLLRYAGHWTLFGYGYFAVEERESGRFVGDVGVAQFRRDGMTEPDGSAEVGWVLSRTFHGKGYGREATAALHGWIDREMAVERTHCIIDPANLASVRIARSLRYVEWKTVVYMGDPVLLLVREK